MAEEKYVELSADQKRLALKRLNEAYHSMQTLHHWIQEDTLNHDMKESLPQLARGYLQDVCEAIGATGEEPDRFKEMTKSLNKARNKEIEELKLALQNADGLVSVPTHVKNIHDALYAWWNEDGFEYIRDVQVTAGGLVKLEFGFMLHRGARTYSKTPDTDEKNAADKYERLKAQGFIFHEEDSENDLLDCDQNRQLLTKMIQKRLPSALITVFKNHVIFQDGPNKGKFRLRGLETVVYEIEDIDKLVKEQATQAGA